MGTFFYFTKAEILNWGLISNLLSS